MIDALPIGVECLMFLLPVWSRALRPSVIARLCAVLLLAIVQGCAKDEADAGFGFELRLPAGWTYISGGVHGATGDTVRYDAAALGQALAQQHAAPLFALLKRAPPQSGLNPTIGVNLERDANARGQSAVALLGTRVDAATRNGPFTLVAAASAAQLAGLPAAQAELHAAPASTAEAGARVRLFLWVIDDVTVLLAATDAVTGMDDTSAELQRTLDSLRLPGARH